MFMVNRLFECKWVLLIFLYTCQFSFAQSDLNDLFVQTDSLKKIELFSQARDLLDEKLKELVKLKDWDQAVRVVDKKANMYENRWYSIAFLNSDTTSQVLSNFPSDDLWQAKIAVQLAYQYDKVGDFPKALTHYDRALAIYEQKKHLHRVVPYTYLMAGQDALTLLDYEKAFPYLKSILRTDTANIYTAKAYGHLSMASNFLENYSDAIDYFEKGIPYAFSAMDIFLLNAEGAIAYANLKNPEQAKALLVNNEQLLELGSKRFVRRKQDDHYRYAGVVYEAINEPQLARDLYRKGVENALLLSDGEKSRSIAKHYDRLADWYFINRDFLKALKAYHNSMIQAFPEFNDTDILKNPSVDQVTKESFMMTSAKGKGNTLIKLFEKTKDVKWLESAQECFDIAFSGATNIRQTFSDEDAKFYLEHFNAKSLEQAIYVNHLLFELKGDSSFIKKAYHLSEQHKSLVLRDAIIKNRSLAEIGIPDSIITREKELFEKVVKAKMEKTNGSDEETVSQTQIDYNIFYNNLKNTYPEFTKRIQQRNHTDIAQIQSKLLDEKTALLQFHWGDENVFVFRIEKDGFELSKISRKELDEPLDAFLKLLPNRAEQEASPDNYFQLAHRLFEVLLKESTRTMNKKVNQLIVVPDGALASLPFEALLSESYNGTFANAPFLINRLSFKYAYSPSLILQEPVGGKNLKGMLAVAPGFENGERNLAPLTQSESEVNSIQSSALLALKGKGATLAAFKNKLSTKQVIHLSTHAQSNTDSFPPRIEFIDKSLFLPELYTMRIPVQLVVLSACEGNLGAYAKGEGVMSLSRGFAYAGAESMIASLWAVNESSTAQLFSNYYNQLKEHTKASALTTAKKDYLQNSEMRDRYKAPYYWAGFVFTGKDGLLEIESASKFQWWMLLLVAFLLVAIIFLKRRK